MNQSILSAFGATGEERVINALNAFKQGNGVLVLDDEDRENEGDLIFPAETITPEQMANLFVMAAVLCVYVSPMNNVNSLICHRWLSITIA